MPAVDDVRGQPDHASVDRRVHVCTRQCPNVERRRSRALAAGELEPVEPPAAAAEHAPGQPREGAGVGLRAKWLQGDRAVAARVIAESGQAGLRDRELDPQRPFERDDLWARRPRGQQTVRR